MDAEKSDLTILMREGPRADDARRPEGNGSMSQNAERSRRVPPVPLPARRWKSRLLLPAVILTTAAGLLAYSARDALSTAIEVQVVPVVVRDAPGQVGQAGPSDRSVVIQAPGWIEPDPYVVEVSALAEGVVREILVLEGAPVKAGEVVARLVDEDARLALRRADAVMAEREAAVRIAEASLEAARGDWDNPVDLTRRLRTAEALLAERRAELERWPSELAVAQARLEELTAEDNRLTELRDRQQAGEIEWVRARQQRIAQQAAVEAVKARKAVLEAQVAQSDAEVAAARDHLRLRIADTRALREAEAGARRATANLEDARAARDEAALMLERMEVRSPSDGVVMAREAHPGTKITLRSDDRHSAHILKLYDPAHLQVRVDVPLKDAARVGVGQRAEVVVDILPDQVFHGRVSRIVHEADVQKNTLQVKVAIDSPGAKLKPEMLARVRFLAHSEGDAGVDPAPDSGERPPGGAAPGRVFAPRRLIDPAADGFQTFVADANGRICRRRAVTPGSARIGDWIEIAEGLRPGDRLVDAARDRLADGVRIRITGESSAAHAGGER